MQPILKVENLKKHFPIRSGLLLKQTGSVYAVNGVSFDVKQGETIGLVGESGCGKSTLGRTIIRIYDPTEGSIHFKGKDISTATAHELKQVRRHMQMIFQDPFSSLNPRKTIGSILSMPLKEHGFKKDDIKARVDYLLDRIGLSPSVQNRYPHEFSGGQRQRIAIARAIAIKPDVVIADEPVSALDVSVQSQILNLLMELREEMNMTMVFIAHDLAVVKHMADRIAVMYLGEIVEFATKEELFRNPKHPYTQALLAANPHGGRKHHRFILGGDVPSPVAPPSGCNFHPRCPFADKGCQEKEPALNKLSHGKVACHKVSESGHPVLQATHSQNANTSRTANRNASSNSSKNNGAPL